MLPNRRERFHSLPGGGGKAEKSRLLKKLVAEDGLPAIRCQPLFIFYFFEKWKGKRERGTLSSDSFLFFLHAHFRSMY